MRIIKFIEIGTYITDACSSRSQHATYFKYCFLLKIKKNKNNNNNFNHEMKIYTYEKHEGNFIFKSNKQNKAFKNSRLITKDIEFNANILFSND